MAYPGTPRKNEEGAPSLISRVWERTMNSDVEFESARPASPAKLASRHAKDIKSPTLEIPSVEAKSAQHTDTGQSEVHEQKATPSKLPPIRTPSKLPPLRTSVVPTSETRTPRVNYPGTPIQHNKPERGFIFSRTKSSLF